MKSKFSTRIWFFYLYFFCPGSRLVDSLSPGVCVRVCGCAGVVVTRRSTPVCPPVCLSACPSTHSRTPPLATSSSVAAPIYLPKHQNKPFINDEISRTWHRYKPRPPSSSRSITTPMFIRQAHSKGSPIVNRKSHRLFGCQTLDRQDREENTNKLLFIGKRSGALERIVHLHPNGESPFLPLQDAKVNCS